MSDLYFECGSGISGDMAVAALLDAGADEKTLRAALDSVPAGGFKVEIARIKKNGIDALDFNVILDSEHESRDHDMHYLFGHESGREGESSRHHPHHHGHGENHAERSGGEDHHHEHRNLSDVLSIIDGTKMTDGARNLARRIFRIIAEAESKAHGIPLEQVHFHEVGAIDSIVDVIAFSVCFDSLSPSRVYIPSLSEGTGTVRCRHGILPVPVPAVASITASYNLPLHIMNEAGEYITPTGAAFAAAVRTDGALPKNFLVKKIGYGAGKRTYERPSILRAFVIETAGSEESPQNGCDDDSRIFKLETNIDDCTGEALGFVMERLFAAGAHDVHYVPCVMKKSRPAYLLCVLCKKKDIARMEEIIFRHTTTIGIRRFAVDRTVLPREEIEVRTPHGLAQVKVVALGDEKRFYPEYESVAEIARRTGNSFIQVFKEITDSCAGLYPGSQSS